MNARLASATGIAGLLYFATLVANGLGTTDGPRPNVAAAKEAARIATEGTAIRWSALLGLLMALTFCAFTTGLAVLVTRLGRTVAGVALAVAGVVTTAVWVLSFAALAAAAQSAQTGARPDLTMALGDLHSVTLLMSFATAGATLLAAVAGDAVRSRTWRAVTILIACAGVASAALVLDVRMDTGPFGFIVILPFWGLPVWVAALSVRLIRGRLAVDATTVPAAIARQAKPA